tara:strand:+ start:1013 stop:2821 length:1809 start_codon:yes stop_codon:yes gene_type:complete
MASLLDYDFDLDKMLGTTTNPIQGLVDDPNFQTEKNIASGLGVADALISGYGTQYAPEIILRSLVNAQSGRQGVIDKKVKSYMTQQDILKATLDAKKLQGDIKRQPYQLLNEAYKAEEYPSKISKSRSEAGISSNKLKGSNLKILALKNKIKKFQEEGNEKELTYIMLNPDEWLKNEFKTDLANNYRKQALPIEWLPAIRAIGLDPDKKGTWSQQDWLDVDNIVKAPLTIQSEKTNLERQLSAKDFPSIISKYNVNSFEGVRNRIINRRREENNNKNIHGDLSENNKGPNKLEQLNLATNTDGIRAMPLQDVYLGDDLKFYERTNRDNAVGKIKPNDKFPDGIIFGSNGINYSNTEWDSIGTENQFAIRPKRDRTDALEREGQVRSNAIINGKKHSYLYSQIDRNNKVIAEILSKPQFLKDLTSVGGRAIINAGLGKYGFTSDVQDIQFLFDKNKNQLFIKEIQKMRANNDTGGAVGNVSNFEVMMFMNAAGAFYEGSSASQLYKELITMRDEGIRAMKQNIGVYNGLYGEKMTNATGISYYDPASYDKGEPRTLKEALKKAGIEDWEERDLTRRLNKEEAAERKELYDMINNPDIYDFGDE